MNEKRIGHMLRIIHNLKKRLVDNSPNKKQVDNVTGTNGWIIAYLTDHSSQDVYQKDLEREFGVTRSTASKVVNLMVQKGLVERQPVAHDARLKKLVLTEKAQSLSELVKKDHQEIEARITKGFSKEELSILYGFLERILENLSSET
ncbi:MAG: MarR family winged helix-turn-helix transcriptional regulator [Acetivibrio ethanolgignens]